MNIILIGMPGCGKSTIGVLLAKALQYSFIDTDLIIQKQSGMSLQQIIDTHGLQEFLLREEQALCSINEDSCVIATGGSAVYSREGMAHLSRNAITVYISLDCTALESRLTNIKTRGVAMPDGSSIASLYEQRSPLYEKYADITLDANGLEIEQSVERTIILINEHLSVSNCTK